MRGLLLLLALPVFAQTRIASDFEIRQMEQQIAKSRDFNAQYSGHLNLGDLRATRNENVQARAEYLKALEIASKERLDARKASELTRYATATSLAAVAQARLHDDAAAFTLAEEAMRYTSDSAKSWNFYANMMSLLGRRAKAVSSARNAVAIGGDPLDLAIYRYTLASALGNTAESETLLQTVISTLRSPEFEKIQQSVRQHEAFEIYTTVRGDESAYISLLNRAQLRLGQLYEGRGDTARAREQYESVLAARNDDPIALAAMTRLSRNAEERTRYFADAFDANPFSIPLIRDYQRFLAGERRAASREGAETTGGRVRLALEQIARGELTAARSTVAALQEKFPRNDALDMLQREIEQRRSGGDIVLRETPAAADLRTLIAAFQDNRLTPEQRTQLDTMTFTSTVVFDASPFESGTVEGVPFRFSGPTQFQGTFAPKIPLKLTYRILGATRIGDADALLLEPVRLQ
jgi:tetratricopeptide (TPR) repeat protein